MQIRKPMRRPFVASNTTGELLGTSSLSISGAAIAIGWTKAVTY